MTYFERVHKMIDQIPMETVTLLVESLKDVRERGNTVYVVGNGGSYANAQHLVLHLRDVNIKAFDLMADNAWLTAKSNDFGYHNALITLLDVVFRPGDMLLVISGSGNSENIKEAVRMIRAIGESCGGLLGNGGGRVAPYIPHAIVLPELDYGPLEDCFSVVVHILHEALK